MTRMIRRYLLTAALLCLAASYCPTARAVEGDLYLLGVALNQQTIPGGWAPLGPPGNWRATIAGTVLDSQLYTVESNGGLFATDPLTGQWRQIGNPEFADTVFLFAAAAKLYSIEKDGSLYAINSRDGTWRRIGAAAAWQATRAGAVLNSQLYTVENDGGLFVTDLSSGQWRQIGRPDFAATVFLFAAGGSLYSIEADGSLYCIAANQGRWVRVGPPGAWRGVKAGAILGGQLYTAEEDGGLYATNLASGERRQFGKPAFAGTLHMFAAAGQLNTIEADGTLYRVNVAAPPIDPYAWCVDELAKVFREQGSGFYRSLQLRTVIGRQATNSNVAEGLQWLRRSAAAKDLAVIYIGCHGVTDPNEGWGFWTAEGDMFWGHRIKHELGKLPCQALIVIETCTSGGFATSHGNDPPVPPNVTAICACAANQAANNELDLAIGEALYGRADGDQDGVVDLDELIAYVPRRYQEWWPDAAGAENSRTPVIVKAKREQTRLPLTKKAENLAAIAHHGSIWSALLERQEGDRFRVHLLGWSNRPGEPYFLTNEVPRDFICLPGDGAPLLVEQNGTWYPARLLGRDGPRYRVHYLGWNEDEEVASDRIRYPFAGRAAP